MCFTSTGSHATRMHSSRGFTRRRQKESQMPQEKAQEPANFILERLERKQTTQEYRPAILEELTNNQLLPSERPKRQPKSQRRPTEARLRLLRSSR